MTQSAKIVVSIRDGVLEISGSEEFVREQLKKFDDLIIKHLSNMSTLAQPSIPSSPQPAPEEGAQDNAWKAVSYHNVMAFDRDGLRPQSTITRQETRLLI